MSSGSGGVKVFDGGDPILPHPWVKGVSYIVFLANLADLGGDKGVPGGGHAGEQVVLHLKVESSRDASANESTVGARCLDLGLVPADLFSLFAGVLDRIAVHFFKVVREGKQKGQREGFRNPHEHNVSNGCEGLVVVKGNDAVDVNVHETESNGVLAALDNVVAVHAHSRLEGPALPEIQHLGVKDGRQPVSSQHKEVKKGLELVDPLARGMVERVVVKEEHGLGSTTIGVLLFVVGVGVVGPVLFHPEPLASSNQVGSQTQEVVDPRSLGSGSVVGIVLDIQPNESLGDTVQNGHAHGASLDNPHVLEAKEQTNIEEASEVPPHGAKLTTTSDNLEDLRLEFPLKGCVKLVAVVSTNETRQI